MSRAWLSLVFMLAGCSCSTPPMAGMDTGPHDALVADVVALDTIRAASTYSYCIPSRPFEPGRTCASPSDSCIALAPPGAGEICSPTCVTDADCPPVPRTSGACLPLAQDGGRVCVLRCGVDEPGACFLEQTCVAYDGMTYCL